MHKLQQQTTGLFFFFFRLHSFDPYNIGTTPFIIRYLLIVYEPNTMDDRTRCGGLLALRTGYLRIIRRFSMAQTHFTATSGKILLM